MKSEQFKEELKYLKNDKIREDAIYLINELPDYFFKIPASSTGKYHPQYSLGDGGLLRHSKAAVRIAYELLQDPVIAKKYTDMEQDIMLVALMIHDGLKLGLEKSKYTKVEHPLLMADMIMNNKNNLHLTDEELNLLVSVIKSHMGPWNKDFDGNEILPVPATKYENFVHMCDYLASRKCLLVPFDEKNNIVV